MRKEIKIDNIKIGNGNPLCLIAGPCVIENYEMTYNIASYLKNITDEIKMPFVFKASFDKANRTSISSYRGPGITNGIKILKKIKEKLNIKIISDIHEKEQVEKVAEVLDIIQIPAFLCRQTDLILKATKTNKIINIKKGQFMAPNDILHSIKKAQSIGNKNIFITERGTSFGYNNLVVDFRGIKIMQDVTKCPVIFDATHSVQIPGGNGIKSGGKREFAPPLARAAVAAGADGVFFEVHPKPDEALCDGANSLVLDKNLKTLLIQLQKIKEIIK